MSLVRKIKDVKVGSIFKLQGKSYKVVAHNHIDLAVAEQVFPGVFSATTRSLKGLGFDTRPDALIWLESEPGGYVQPQGTHVQTQASLTASLKGQIEQQKLTASLKAQISDNGDRDDVDDDYWSDEYGYDEEGVEERVEAVEKDALTANLRAQAAQAGAIKAGFKATEAITIASGAQVTAKVVAQKIGEIDDLRSEVSGAIDDLDHYLNNVADEVGVVKEMVYDVQEEVSDVNHVIDNVCDAQEDLEYRLAKIESKIEKEERKMNLQEKLNASLAKQEVKASLQSQLNKSLKKHEGGNVMNNLFGGFKSQFGKVTGKFAFSPVTGGLAIKKFGTEEYAAFDGATITNVSGLTLKFDVPAFKLPVAADQVKKGDIVLNGADFGFVTKVSDGYVETVNVEKNVRGSVLPTKNLLLNGSFYTVVRTLDAAGEGGFNPMLLMALDKGGDKKDLLPILLMSGGLGGAKGGAIDPMTAMALFSDGDIDELLPLVLMQQGGVAGGQFNPLLLMATQKGGKFSDLLPILAMSGGLGGAAGQGQAGAINPLLFMAMGDGGTDMKDLFMMQALTGQNIFGGTAPVAAPQTEEKK